MIYRCSSRRNLQRHWWEKTEAGPAQNGRGRRRRKKTKADKGYALTERKIYSKMTERGKRYGGPRCCWIFMGRRSQESSRMQWSFIITKIFSLSEIAENLKISRQAALDSIQRAQKHLNKMEHQLGMLKKIPCMRRCGGGN